MPLLVLWFGYREHEATGTSLAAIAVIAVFAVAPTAPTATSTSARACSSACPPSPAWWPAPRCSSACPAARLADVRRAAGRRRDRAADRVNELAAILLGFPAGAVGGLLGVGGGILFVPALVDLPGPVPARRGGDVAARDHPGRDRRRLAPARLRQRADPRRGSRSACCRAGGVVVGTVVANTVPERALEVGFACLVLFFAAQLRGARFSRPGPPAPDGTPPARARSRRSRRRGGSRRAAAAVRAA